MRMTSGSYARAKPTPKGSIGLRVIDLKTKCNEVIYKAHLVLGKPNGYSGISDMILQRPVIYNALISLPLRDTEREVVL